MENRSVELTPEARTELFEASAYYEERRPGLWGRFLDSMAEGLERIAEAPEAQSPASGFEDESIRSARLRRFPYYLVFLELPDESLRVLAVAHVRRRPGYWRSTGRLTGKESWTEFETLAEFSRSSLLRARIHTGRRHQVRRHLHHLAHQVIGDTKHGKGKINRSLRELYGLPRMFLHAATLELRHPLTEAPLRFEAPLAADLRAYLQRPPDVPAELIDSLYRQRQLHPEPKLRPIEWKLTAQVTIGCTSSPQQGLCRGTPLAPLCGGGKT